jgi:crotonobetainyl-CoA:carnitine CoA-transferase CaiB-like acyl-CoA transferase
MASGPLDGIRVLEFSQIIAGPFGCQNLADMGAEVIKVEPPEGEPWRSFAQFIPDESKWFQSLNRGKRSLVLKLQDERAQRVVHDLIPSVDVVVINYRPDVPERLAIDYETLRAIRPDLIYIDNTAFGREGPWAHRPGYDIVVQAVTGLMAAEAKTDERGAPELMATAVADYATGLAIAWATCAALFHRERTGEGQLIESSLLATALALQGSQVMELPAADEMRSQMMERVRQLRSEGADYPELLAAHDPFRALRAGNIFYRAYKTKNGALAIGGLSKGLRDKIRSALGIDFLGMDDPNADMLSAEFQEAGVRAVGQAEEVLASKTTEQWMEIFDREGVPAGPVNFAEEMVSDPQVVANGLVVELEHDLAGPQRQVAPILRFARTPLEAQGSSPPLGRDTDEIMQAAGYSANRIAELREAGVIG